MKNNNDYSFDILDIPLSKYGSHIAVAIEDKKLSIYNALERFNDETFNISFKYEGKPIKYTIGSNPYVMEIESTQGNTRIYIRDDRSLVIDSNKLDVILEHKSKHGYGIMQGSNFAKFFCVEDRRYSAVDILHGKARLDGPIRENEGYQRNHREILEVKCEKERVLLLVDISNSEKKYHPPTLNIADEIEAVRSEWEEFYNKMPDVPGKFREIANLCWYTTWSCFIRANDAYAYDALLMAKKVMSSIWTWDHCFNTLALAYVDKKMALEQFLIPFERQAASGVLPDMWNPNSELVWAVTKPPIHGWCFTKLMQKFEFERPILEKVVDHLIRWTDFWLDYRDFDGDGIPAYPQGCDSGWDNSALFFPSFFIESPDLSAFLVLQMRTIAEIYDKLGNSEAKNQWLLKSDDLLKRLIEHSWNGKRFLAKRCGTHEYEEIPLSALAYMPLILGDLLDEDMRIKLSTELEKNYFTKRGIANNIDVKKGKYVPSGGIWASIQYLFIDGLRSSGFEEKAQQMAQRFYQTIVTEKGPHEGFKLDKGTYGVPGYTWTSSVSLLLIWEYLS